MALTVDRLKERELAALVEALLVRQGFEVVSGGDSRAARDLGVDIVAREGGRIWFVEVKSGPLNALESATRLLGARQLGGADHALLVINGAISEALLLRLTQPGLTIWDGAKLEEVVASANLSSWPSGTPPVRPGGILLHRLDLAGFRGFRHAELDLSLTRSTVFVGRNGSGKSSILLAIAHLLSWWVARVRSEDGKGLQIAESHIHRSSAETALSLRASLEGRATTWTLAGHRAGHRKIMSSNLAELSERTRAAQLRREVDADSPLPAIVYYPVTRAVLDVPKRIRSRHSFGPLETYEGALWSSGWTFRLFFEWFRAQEDKENELRLADSGHRDRALQAVRGAIERLMPGFARLRVSRAPQRMLLDKDGTTFEVDQLSDGEKCLLALVGDLARRLALANPKLDDPLQGSGVVLIDEIELHLHPAWQRDAIPGLERTFPGCQFIVTTHSPQVLSHVQGDGVVVLRAEEGGITAERASVFGWDSNRILNELFEVPERPAEVAELLSALFAAIDQGDLADARERRAELGRLLGEDEPQLKKADALVRRRELIGR